MDANTLDAVPVPLRPLLGEIGAVVVLSARLEWALRYVQRRVTGSVEVDHRLHIDGLVKSIRQTAMAHVHSAVETNNVTSWASDAKAALTRRGDLVHAIWSSAADGLAAPSTDENTTDETLFLTKPRGSTTAAFNSAEMTTLCNEMQRLLRNADGSIAKQAGRIARAPRRQPTSEAAT